MLWVGCLCESGMIGLEGTGQDRTRSKRIVPTLLMMNLFQLMFDIFRSEDKLPWEIDCFKGFSEGWVSLFSPPTDLSFPCGTQIRAI